MQTLQATIRQTITFRIIESGDGIQLEELLERVKKEMRKHGFDEIDLSERTLKRTIEKLREHISVPYTRKKGYYIPEDEEVSDYFKYIMESFDILYALNADMGMSHLVFPEKQANKGTKHIIPLLEAIQQRCFVTFRYQKYDESTLPTERHLAPYALKESHRRWYLLGIEKGDNRLKTYGLDRISLLRTESGKFKRQEIDIDALYKYSYDIYSSTEEEAEEILLSFDKRDAKYVESLPIHQSQQTLPHPTDSGRIMFRLYLKITEGLILALLSRGTSMQVHSPEYLREEICRQHREALQINTPKESPAKVDGDCNGVQR